MVVPGSHKTDFEPTAQALSGFDAFRGAIQVCCPAGSCVIFHNALWHTCGPATRADGRRIMLYYAYEHPWMIGSPEHTAYPREFHAGLSPHAASCSTTSCSAPDTMREGRAGKAGCPDRRLVRGCDVVADLPWTKGSAGSPHSPTDAAGQTAASPLGGVSSGRSSRLPGTVREAAAQ